MSVNSSDESDSAYSLRDMLKWRGGVGEGRAWTIDLGSTEIFHLRKLLDENIKSYRIFRKKPK